MESNETRDLSTAERLDEHTISVNGEIETNIEGQDGVLLPTNSDVIEDSILEDYVQQSEKEDEQREKAKKAYDEMLEDEAEKPGMTYDLARARLESKGFIDPDEIERRQEAAVSASVKARRQRIEDHERQERELGLSGVVHRSPEDEVAIGSLVKASDESQIKKMIDYGYTLNEAIARIKIRNDRKKRDI
ncbi:MAG TPA: hypothetical protein PLZ58_00475 [Candidatus Saccharibacteria bacterium]|nr:hypothetical protein [Candidatus Saccharibacteria bacterium]HRQ07205.1 hypothetical protein [Candidatus Saccharibacteria bacterium]